MERLGVLHRQLDAFLELFDRVAHAADIGPADPGHLHHDFAHGGRLDALQRREEVFASDIEFVEHFGRNRPLVEIDLRHDPAHRIDRGLARERGDIRTDEAVSGARQLGEVDLVAQGHAAGVDAEDFAPPLFVGHADHDFAVEAARPAQRLVDRVGAIGCGNHDEVRTRLEPVHQSQQLRDEALLRLAGDAVALGRNRIDLVDENDGRRVLGRLLEHFAQRLLAFAIARSHDLGAIDGEEIGIAFIGDRLRQPRLARSRRTVQQHALGRINAETGEQFGIAQRQFDHLAQLLDGVFHPPDIVVIDHRAGIAGRFELGAQLDLGVLVDMDDALGAGGHHAEPDLGERIGRGIEHPAHFGGHVLDGLLPGRGDEIARDERLAEEIALERLRRTLQAHLALRGREYDTRGRARFGNRDIHMFARAGFRIAALKPVEPDDVDGLVFVIGRHRDRRGRALAGDFHHIAFGDAQRLKGRSRHAGDTLPAFLLPCRCHLQPYLRRVFRRCSVSIGHVSWAPVPVGRTAQGGAGSYRCNERVRTEGPAGKKKARLANQPGLEVLGEDA